MSQCYQLLISSLLGNVNMKQDLRQVLLNPHGRHPHLPWGSCGDMQGFTLEVVKPQQISAHQPFSNLLLEPRPFMLT